MNQHKRPKWVSALGLILAGAFIVGAALVTSEPFSDSTAFAAMTEQAERAEAPAPSEGTGTDDVPPGAAKIDAAANLTDLSVVVAQADTGESAGEATSEPAEEPPTDPVAEKEAEAQEAAEEELAAEEAEDKCCKKGDKTPPFELIAKTPPGELHNPYDWKELAEEHKDNPDYLVKQFRLPGCNECHGGGGGGGFCPALSQGVWFWGNTDDVLFRLIALGSAELEKQGWTRYQYGTVKAPMPEMGHVIKTSDHLWQIVSFIRSINPPGTNPPEKVIPGKYTAPVEERQAE
ncbi:hypothetical protein AUC68_13415 [Methyloceanibacter methanicus]|uniref:Cytochrome c domain-containing protein n=1 Tax=Methyloceanibacter methanicus TaxID=1774968 RepID=A0A1E3W5Z3_9HYPH|nr:hypothetical protein [Methyloceanibacter methanicus]ODS00922.1 hypothetical protein AUC68_13415 [Methyloceanibacter methanicus]